MKCSTSQDTEMEREAYLNVQTSQPFDNLEDLYTSLDNLTPWPSSVNLRETTEYVYLGSEIISLKDTLTKIDRDSPPKTLVCHDMKGGYLEDRFIDGSSVHDSYIFYHWSVVDIFVYFSHHFVTIPPYGWINAAHNHGVKILGTVITEHSAGIQICEKFLETRESVEKFADALVTIAKFYNFEGWLLNIENSIKAKDMENLTYFVRYLTDHIHQAIEESEIIWYDSVVNTGELNWQNELNDKNKDFFLNCDGIFLNYNWSDSGLARSSTVAKNEGRDVTNVYVGLDVWGRGCPGGGGFNSAHALERIRRQGLSAAIFAPAWTHEYFGPTTFRELENIFWAQLFPHLYVHVPIYDNERFKTSFCAGAGLSYFRCGEVQLEMQVTRGKGLFKEKSFYNLTLQKPQISVPVPHLKFTYISQPPIPSSKDTEASKQKQNEPEERVYETSRNVIRVRGKEVNFEAKNSAPEVNRFEYCHLFSFEGGCCLKLVTRDTTSYHRLFLVHVEFEQVIQATVVYSQSLSSNDVHSRAPNDPILILGNDSSLKSIIPYESSSINSKWKKCVYLTNMRTVNEIGVSFARTDDCYLGQIVLESRQSQYGDHAVFVCAKIDDPEQSLATYIPRNSHKFHPREDEKFVPTEEKK